LVGCQIDGYAIVRDICVANRSARIIKTTDCHERRLSINTDWWRRKAFMFAAVGYWTNAPGIELRREAIIERQEKETGKAFKSLSTCQK
jgi:hypothetical protein